MKSKILRGEFMAVTLVIAICLPAIWHATWSFLACGVVVGLREGISVAWPKMEGESGG